MSDYFEYDEAELVDISSVDFVRTGGGGFVIQVGVAGNIKVTTSRGTDLTLLTVPVGLLRLRVKKVFKTGTAATKMIALFNVDVVLGANI